MTDTHTTATKTAGATPGIAAQPGPEVGIEADLALEVTGPHGHTNAQVYGSGRRLLLRADRPDVLLAAAAGPARAGVLDMLAQAEVAVELRGPRGRLLSVDPQRRSRVGALLWGSPHVRVDPSGWATIVRAAAPRARKSATRPRSRAHLERVASFAGAATAITATVTAATIAGARVHRRHRRRVRTGGVDGG